MNTSFKVMCIDADNDAMGIETSCDWDVTEGGIYTVVQDFMSIEGVYCYCLLEDPEHETFGWRASRFIPLSEIDETELVNEVNKETV